MYESWELNNTTIGKLLMVLFAYNSQFIIGCMGVGWKIVEPGKHDQRHIPADLDLKPLRQEEAPGHVS